MEATLVDPAVTARKQSGKTAIIDTDIHVAMTSAEMLLKFLPKSWHRHHEIVGGRGHIGSAYPRMMPNAARRDALPPNGGPPGSDLEFLREQLLDAWQMDYGILTPLAGSGGEVNLKYGAALAAAYNDWQIEEWVNREPRLRASIMVAYEDGELAAREIERVGDLDEFVQVLLMVRTREPLGHRRYWKMYEAAVRHELPIAIHFGGAGGGPITGSGWPSHYIEDHGGMPQAFQPQVASLVFSRRLRTIPDAESRIDRGRSCLDASADLAPRPVLAPSRRRGTQSSPSTVRVCAPALLDHYPADGGAAQSALF